MVTYLRPPDIEAEITFVATVDGGRRGSAQSGYRPDHDLGLETLNGAAHEYLDQEWVEPGATARAYLRFLAPEYQAGRLYPGFKFTVQEGRRIVGHGVVVAVLNASMLRKTP